MVLVLISVAMAVILSLSFLNAQVTATGMTKNIARHAQAHSVAESGLTMALAYLHTTSHWRTQVHHGTWIKHHAFGGGSFTVIGEDGQDTDGDGTPDGDSDLADDEADPVTLTSIGTVDGVSHTVHAVVTPLPPKKRLLMVVPSASSTSSEDDARRSQFVDWDYQVTLIDDSDSQDTFNNAVADVDVVYIPEYVGSSTVNTKLRDAPIGVVYEENHLNDSFGMATTDGPSYSGYAQINVTDDAHFITETLSIGLTKVLTSPSYDLQYVAGTLAPGAAVLATQTNSDTPVLAALEAGATLTDGTPAAGRRVILPWGDGNFVWSALAPGGLVIVERALEWASQPVIAGQIAHWDLDELTGTTAGDSVGTLDGTYRNGVALGTQGAFMGSTAACFDGANDHVEIPHDSAFLLDEGTFAFWFMTGDTVADQGLLSKDSSGYDTGGHVSIEIDDGSEIEVCLQSLDDSYTTEAYAGTSSETNLVDETSLVLVDGDATRSSLQANTWYHVAFTFGPGGMKLYLNGMLVGSNAYTGGMGSTSGGAGNFEPMALGVSTRVSGDSTLTGWNYPLAGTMDDVYVFNRALTQTEIQKLMHPVDAARGLQYDVRWIDQP